MECGTFHACRRKHLVETIVARFPFPSILKARLFSKEWKSKFSSEARRGEASSNWPQYFCYFRISDSEVVGYDAVLESVKRIPVRSAKLLSRGGRVLSRVPFYAFSGGPLLVTLVGSCGPATSVEVVVNNVLTRNWKKITCSFGRRVVWYEPVLVSVGTEHYELVFSYRWYSEWTSDPSPYRVREFYTTFAVYNSESCSWMEKSHLIGDNVRNSSYMDGTLYYITANTRESLRFVRFDIESGDRAETPIHVDGEVTLHFTIRCGSAIMTVIAVDNRNLIVSQLDTESFALIKMSRSPILEKDANMFAGHRHRVHHFSASRNRVYLTSSRVKDDETPLLWIYEVDSKTWSRSCIPQEFSENPEPAMHSRFVMELGLTLLWNLE